MYRIVEKKPFGRSLKRLKLSGRTKDLLALKKTIDLLATGNRLPANYKDHELSGNLAGLRECHVRGNLLLVYAIHQSILLLVLINVGTHHEIFGA